MITAKVPVGSSPTSIWSDYEELLRVSAPLIIASLSNLLIAIVDTAMVGRVSVEGLAAVAAGNAVFLLASQIVAASTAGYQILAAKRFGANDGDQVSSAFWHSILFTLPIATILTLILIAFALPLISWMTPVSEVAQQAIAYLTLRSPGLILLVAAGLLRITFSANKQTYWAMYEAFLANTTNIAFSYLFIFGPGPFPALGAPGSGLGSTLAFALAFLFLLIAFFQRDMHKYFNPIGMVWRKEEIFRIGQLSLPMIGSSALDYLGNLLFFGILGMLGSDVLAGNRIAFNLMLFLFVLTMGFGTGIQILMGRSWGANDLVSAKRCLQRGRWLAMIVVGVVSVPVALWPELIIRLFTPFEQVQMISVGAVRLVGISTPLLVWAISHASALRAFGRTQWDMMTNVAPVWLLQLPLTWLLSVMVGWNLTGAYVAFAGYWLVRALATNLLSHRAFRLAAPEVPV